MHRIKCRFQTLNIISCNQALKVVCEKLVRLSHKNKSSQSQTQMCFLTAGAGPFPWNPLQSLVKPVHYQWNSNGFNHPLSPALVCTWLLVAKPDCKQCTWGIRTWVYKFLSASDKMFHPCVLIVEVCMLGNEWFLWLIYVTHNQSCGNLVDHDTLITNNPQNLTESVSLPIPMSSHFLFLSFSGSYQKNYIIIAWKDQSETGADYWMSSTT